MSEADNIEPVLLRKETGAVESEFPDNRAGDAAPEGAEPWDHPAIRAEHVLLGQDKAAGKREFAGLAFSGGGIRSATFGLGVLQALKEKHLLEKFDYLSSVSGGGYISAWLSANCRRHGSFWLTADANWNA